MWWGWEGNAVNKRERTLVYQIVTYLSIHLEGKEKGLAREKF